MQNMQRALLVLTVAGALWFGVFMLYQESSKKIQEQWEAVKTERFLKEICWKRECSYEELRLYFDALNYADTHSEIQVEEYRREWDRNGNSYYYLVSWEELSEAVVRDGAYAFEEGSVIKVCVIRRNGKTGVKKQYYDTVAGKD